MNVCTVYIIITAHLFNSIYRYFFSLKYNASIYVLRYDAYKPSCHPEMFKKLFCNTCHHWYYSCFLLINKILSYIFS